MLTIKLPNLSAERLDVVCFVFTCRKVREVGSPKIPLVECGLSRIFKENSNLTFLFPPTSSAGTTFLLIPMIFSATGNAELYVFGKCSVGER